MSGRKTDCRLILILGLGLVGQIQAEALIIDGHVGGDRVNLRLTHEQSRVLDSGWDRIRLTEVQVKSLSRALRLAGRLDTARKFIPRYREGVSNRATIDELVVFRSTDQVCTCGLANAAVRTSGRLIEVPLRLLGRDVVTEDAGAWEPHRSAENASFPPDKDPGSQHFALPPLFINGAPNYQAYDFKMYVVGPGESIKTLAMRHSPTTVEEFVAFASHRGRDLGVGSKVLIPIRRGICVDR